MMRIAALMRPEGTDMRQVTFTCKHCGIRISWDSTTNIWFETVDGGDACCGEIFTEKNIDGHHEPR